MPVCATVFSCTDYCGFGNRAGVLVLSASGVLSPVLVEPLPLPPPEVDPELDPEQVALFRP